MGREGLDDKQIIPSNHIAPLRTPSGVRASIARCFALKCPPIQVELGPGLSSAEITHHPTTLTTMVFQDY